MWKSDFLYNVFGIDGGEAACTYDECKFLRNFRNVQSGCTISKLVCNFAISNLRSAISKLRKFANFVEHIHVQCSSQQASLVHSFHCERKHHGQMFVYVYIRTHSLQHTSMAFKQSMISERDDGVWESILCITLFLRPVCTGHWCTLNRIQCASIASAVQTRKAKPGRICVEPQFTSGGGLEVDWNEMLAFVLLSVSYSSYLGNDQVTAESNLQSTQLIKDTPTFRYPNSFCKVIVRTRSS